MTAVPAKFSNETFRNERYWHKTYFNQVKRCKYFLRPLGCAKFCVFKLVWLRWVITRWKGRGLKFVIKVSLKSIFKPLESAKLGIYEIVIFDIFIYIDPNLIAHADHEYERNFLISHQMKVIWVIFTFFLFSIYLT